MLVKSSSFALQHIDKMFTLVRNANLLLQCVTLSLRFQLPEIGVSGLEVTCAMYLDTTLAELFVESQHSLILSL